MGVHYATESLGDCDVLLWMEEILHQLIGRLFLYKVLYIPGGAGFPSTV